MKKLSILIISALILIVLCSQTFALGEKLITLNDGSVLQGTVLSLKDGIYTVQTNNLGTVEIKAADIQSIATPGVNQRAGFGLSSPQGNILNNPQMQQMQMQLLNNPSVMQDIQTLMENEEIMEAFSDENFMNAIMSGDATSIQNNPKLDKLMQNPDMQRLIEKIQTLFSPQSTP